MTEKKYFCLKTFFVIKYFRFSFIFYVKIATPLPKKIHPPLSQQPPIKADGGCQNLPFENLVGGSIPHQKKGHKTAPTFFVFVFNFFKNVVISFS